MAPRETENNAYAKFWGDKQRTLWYVMVFLEWSIQVLGEGVFVVIFFKTIITLGFWDILNNQAKAWGKHRILVELNWSNPLILK